MADTFVIEEQDRRPERLELADHGLPFGRPRKGSAWKFGGPVTADEIKLDGRTTPIIHTRHIDFHPTEIKGHWRDRYGGAGYAQQQMDTAERIRQRQRLLNLSFGPWKWVAFLKEGTWDVEGTGDILYHFQFTILRGPGVDLTRKVPTQETTPSDATAQARALLAADRVRFAIMGALATAQSEDLLAQFDAADTALDGVEQAADAFSAALAAASSPLTQGKRLIAKAAEAKQRCSELATTLVTADPSDMLTSLDASSTMDWSSATYDTVADCGSVSDTMWNLQYTARQAIRKTTRLYQVAPGDTLERIAATQLGNPALASTLGLQPSDLVPGRVIRIPTT